MEELYRYGDLVAWAPALALLLVAALASFSRIFERNPATLALLLIVTFWIWADITHGFVGDPGLKLLMFYLQFAFLAFIPVAWISTCLRIVGKRSTLGTLSVVALAVVGVAFVVLLVIDDRTHWFFQVVTLPAGSWTVYRHNGPAYYVFVTILFSALALGVVLLARARPLFSLIDHQRSSLFLWGVATPMVAGLIDVFHLLPEPRIALVPWGLFLTAAFFLVSIFRGKLFAPGSLAYETVVRQMADPVVVMGSTGQSVWINAAFRKAFPTVDPGSDGGWAEGFPALVAQLDLLRSGGEVEVRLGEREFRVKGTPAQDVRSGFEALALVFQDVTALKLEQARLQGLAAERALQLEAELERSRQTQQGLERLVAEKEMLLQEVNHRVKNNLQIILSLINLQARRLAKDSQATALFAATQGRIRSISLVHELIYRSEFGAGLDFRRYLEELVQGIAALYSQHDVKLEVLPSNHPLKGGVDFSVDFGLVVNELVTNAFKHGIVPAGGGLVTVGLEQDAGWLVLAIHDSGPGFPEGGPPSSLGLSLVRSVLKKYRAELRVSNDHGTLVEVRVPWTDA